MKEKSEMKRYKFENLLIAFLINRQQYYLSIVDGKSEMRRNKFENLLMTFLISKQQSYLSNKDGKKWDEEVEVENLLIAILISKQRKKCHLKICQSVLFTTKICQSVLFLMYYSCSCSYVQGTLVWQNVSDGRWQCSEGSSHGYVGV